MCVGCESTYVLRIEFISKVSMNWFQGKGTNFIRATGSGIQFRLQTRVSILSLKAKHIQRKGRIFLRALILWRRTRKQNYLSFSKGQKQLRCSSSNCVIRTVFVLLLLLAFLRSGTPEAHLKGEKENSNCWWMLHKIFDMVHISLCLYYGLLQGSKLSFHSPGNQQSACC